MKQFGIVKEGKLILNNRRNFMDQLQQFEGKDVEVRIRQRSEKRTKEQNSLYWKWIEVLSNETGFTKDEMHELIKYKYLKRNIINSEGVEEVVIKSTTTMTTKEFSQFMNDILFWANSTLNINLPSYE